MPGAESNQEEELNMKRMTATEVQEKIERGEQLKVMMSGKSMKSKKE